MKNKKEEWIKRELERKQMLELWNYLDSIYIQEKEWSKEFDKNQKKMKQNEPTSKFFFCMEY